MTTSKDDIEQPGYVALLALEALARYKASGLASAGESMHEDMATRLVRVIDKDSWT